MRLPNFVVLVGETALLGALTSQAADLPALAASKPLAVGIHGTGPHSPDEPTNPQTPAYRTEEVRFRCRDNVLTGSLILPTTPGPHPAIAFILGSGPADRTYYGMAPRLWTHFARRGFACLSWDKPGVGKSTGDYNAQNFPDRAEEALAAVRFLQARPEIQKPRVGLWGHSQGGTVAMLAASLSRDPAFLIEVGGAQVVAWRQDMFRVEAELRADGHPKQEIQEAVAFSQMRMSLIRGDGDFEQLEKMHAGVENRSWFEYAGRCDRKLFYSARKMVEFDPGPAWEKVHCPVLAIYGEKDTSLPAEMSLPIIRDGLHRAGNSDVTITLFPKADHGLITTETGGPKEAKQRSKASKPGAPPNFTPGYLDLMTNWLSKRFRPK